MTDNTHYHICPYCKKTHACTESCYSGRITNMICSECKAKWQGEMTEIKKHGTEWLNQPG